MPVTQPDSLASRVPARQRRWMIGASVLLSVTVLLAVLLPVSRPDGAAQRRAAGQDQGATLVTEEALTAFLDSTRWGRSLREIQAEADAARFANEINPVLAEMGYVGLIVSSDDSAMLLKLLDGQVTRLALGDRTPDGRTLSSLTDNTLTLTGGDGSEEVLELFARRAIGPGA